MGEHIPWRAKWIWLDYITPFGTSAPYKAERMHNLKNSEKNRWGVFRKSFDLPEGFTFTDPAILAISVDSRYQLFLNGTYIGRGIYRCNKYNWYYDQYDITALLKPGKNVIAVIATFFGEDMSWYESFPPGNYGTQSMGKGGLFFQTILPLESGILDIISDKSTRGMICNAWDQRAPRINIGLPFMENFNANKWEEVWLQNEFDDINDDIWGHSIELHVDPAFPRLVKCDIPRLSEEKVRAPTLLTVGTVEPYFDEEDRAEPETDQQDRIDSHLQLAFSKIKSTDPEEIKKKWKSSNGEITWNLENGTLGLVFDMEKMVSGFIFFEIECDTLNTFINLAWSEKLDPAKDYQQLLLPGWKQKYGMQYRSRTGQNYYQMFHWQGFRYFQMNISGKTGTIKLKSAGTVLYLYPVNQIGSFKCSNPILDQLYDVCRWTLRNCMHDGYEDCPSREQRQWVGDAYVEIMVAFALFGETNLTKKFLRQVAQSQRGDGLIQMATPGDTAIHGLTIPDYSLYYIMAVYQYYWYTGDESCIKEHLPTILKILRWFLDYQDLVTGLITNVPQWIFIDWSENDKWGACGALNAQVYHTLEIVLEMIRIVNWIPLIEELIPIARNITEGINQYLWDEQRQAYVDAVEVSSEGKVVKKSNKVTFQTNAWILLFDIAPAERRDQVFASVFDQPLSNIYVHNRNPIWTSLTPKKYDPDTHIVMAEPFFMHQVNQLFNKRERSDLLARYLYEGWGAMIKKGASTIWETWSDGGSLCHAWSTSPAYDLVSYVLGVEFSLPGAEEVQLTPHIMDLTWAEGVVPTIKGPIHIRWDWNLEEKALIVKYSAPSGVNMILSPPLFNNQPHRVVKPLEIHGRGENIFRIDY